jgi:hypothetical protein
MSAPQDGQKAGQDGETAVHGCHLVAKADQKGQAQLKSHDTEIQGRLLDAAVGYSDLP